MHARNADRSHDRFDWSLSAKVLGMCLLVLGAKFCVLRMCSSPLPVYDQWEAEGQNLLRPWLRHELHLGDLFAPWVQHRIVWTRLLVLGLFQINGQWDTQVESIAAEFLRAVTAALLGIILARRLGRVWEDAILFCILLLFALPFDLEATLSSGFHSQYYLLLLFAVITIWGLGSHSPGSVGWWIGAAGAAADWFTVATGWLSVIAVAVWMGMRLARREGSPRENAITLAVALALGTVGFCLSIGVRQLGTLQPHTAGEFLVRYAGLLAWPNPTAWLALVAYAPLACFTWRTIRRGGASRSAAFLIPLGVFTLLNTAALAYARNRDISLMVSRYMEFQSFGTLVNFSCLLLLVQPATEGEVGLPTRRWRIILPVGWITVTSSGLISLTMGNIATDIPLARARTEREVESVTAFVARPDPQHLVRKDPYLFQCDPPQVAEDLLQDPTIRRILPWQGRLPIFLEEETGSSQRHNRTEDPDDPSKMCWVLEPGHNGQPVRFRSRTIADLRFPYLRFPEISDMGGNAFMSLVDEGSAEKTEVVQNSLRSGPQSVLLKTPTLPFRVEAVIAAGSNRQLVFLDPREVGRLSAWVDVFLDSSITILIFGGGIWLTAILIARLAPGPTELADAP